MLLAMQFCSRENGANTGKVNHSEVISDLVYLYNTGNAQIALSLDSFA